MLLIQREDRRNLDGIFRCDRHQTLVKNPVMQATQRYPVARIIVMAITPRHNMGGRNRRAALWCHDADAADRTGMMQQNASDSPSPAQGEGAGG